MSTRLKIIIRILVIVSIGLIFLTVMGQNPLDFFRYRGFPHFERHDDKISVDALISRGWIMNHSVIILYARDELTHQIFQDEPTQQHFFEIPRFGQMSVMIPEGKFIDCPELIRLEGELDDYGGEGYILLEKMSCLDFLRPDHWHDFRVVNGSVQGFVVNPFPHKQKFKIKINVSGTKWRDEFPKDIEVELWPGMRKDFDIPFPCLESNSEYLSVDINFEGDYHIFNNRETVDYKSSQCGALKWEEKKKPEPAPEVPVLKTTPQVFGEEHREYIPYSKEEPQVFEDEQQQNIPYAEIPENSSIQKPAIKDVSGGLWEQK